MRVPRNFLWTPEEDDELRSSILASMRSAPVYVDEAYSREGKQRRCDIQSPARTRAGWRRKRPCRRAVTAKRDPANARPAFEDGIVAKAD